MTRKSAVLLGIAALCWMPVTPAQAAAKAAPTPVPDLTQNGKKDGLQYWNLGPTGVKGGVFCRGFDTSESRQILVSAVEKGSPAEGMLAVDDVILGVNGKPFTSDARQSLGEAITEAEKTRNKGELNLLRWRAGERSEVTIPLRVMGSYSDTSPYRCEKAKKIVAEGCRAIVKRGLGNDIPGHINALALLASGNPEYLETVKAYAHKVGPADFKLELKEGMFAWGWGYANLFLTEYYLATKDEYVLPAIREYTTKIATGQGVTGTWGHGMRVDGNNGTLGGYGAINQAGLICWLSLVLGQKCGVTDPVVQQAVATSAKFFGFYVTKGSIPYGDHPPYTLLHDDNGKSGSPAVTFDLLGNAAAARFFSRMATAAYEEKENGHTGNYFSFLWGALGANRAGPDAVAAYLKELRWYYDLARRWDGSFFTIQRDNYNWDMTGLFVLHYALPLQKLYITGQGVSSANRLTGKELKNVIECGRSYRYGHDRDCDNDKSIAALLTGLTSWSPTVRYRAARALAQKPDDVVPQLVALLQTGDLQTQYGACAALQELGGRGAAATDELIRQLSARDMWLRIQAAQALGCVGAPAHKAVPQLLQMVARTQPDDPRGIESKYVGYALLRDQFIDQMPRANGLIAGSVEGVDRQLLFPAIRRLLALDDGLGTFGTASFMKTLTTDELKTLTPDLVRVARDTAPSGEMFAQDIRLQAIRFLAKNKIPEGLPAMMEYIRTQNGWGSKTREVLKEMKNYGAAALSVLPELKQLRDGWKLKEKDQQGETRSSIADEVIRALEAGT